MQVIVLGMHRSGTSMLSRILNMMGLYFGAEGYSTGLNEENPKGFWERLDVRRLNDYVLLENGFDWNKISEFKSIDQFSEETKKHFLHEGKKIVLGMDAFRPWFLKEPRFCLTLPLWRQLFEMPIVIHIYRNPVEVAESLQKRNGFPIPYGLALWERYNQLALEHSYGLPLLSINHSSLIQNPLKSIREIREFLEIHEVPNLRQPTEKEVYGFIEKRFYRNRQEGEIRNILNSSQMVLWNKMTSNEDVSNFEISNDSWASLSQYEIQISKVEELLKEKESLKDLCNELRQQIKLKDQSILELKKEINNNKKLHEHYRIQKIAEQKIHESDLRKLKSQLNFQNNQRIKSLEKQLDIKQQDISKKNKLIIDYWERIQEMRIQTRIKRLLLLKPLFRAGKKLIWSLKFLKYKWSLNSKARTIEKFVKNGNDHSLAAREPLVSIIILNRNGLDHLKNFFSFLQKNTIYRNFEIIVFDNDSSDGSVPFLKSLKDITIQIIENHFNDTFSAANNKAAMEARGEMLLFLNNDIMPLYGWLNQMVKSFLKNEDVGSVGSKLIYPKNYIQQDTLKVQHNGIGFRSELGFVRPYNLDNKKDFFDLNHNEDQVRPAVTAACVLVSKSIFEKVGGFDESYNYGYEDVDLGLKFFTQGYKNIIANGSVLYHNEFGTQNKQDNEVVKARRKRNLEHFRNKWYREILNISWEDKLSGRNSLSLKNYKFTIGITVTEQGKYARAGDYFTAKELANEFVELGYNIRFYAQKEENWYKIHEDVDMLLVLLHGYDLSKIDCKNKGLIKAGWIRNWIDKFSDASWFDQFDLIFSSSKAACDYIQSQKRKKAYYFPIATNEKRFGHPEGLIDTSFECDYCFTGNYWQDPREIISMLNPEALPKYKFHLYGKNWEQIEKLRDYNKGFLKYEEIPKVYANTKILIDDANRVTKPWGSVNSRVFDALMSGVLVITNGNLGSRDVFKNKLPVYNNEEELKELLIEYLENDKARIAKVNELQEIVKSNHTYRHRAHEIKRILKDYYRNSLVIKIPVPKMEEAHRWGDYHFALSLQKEFEKTSVRTKVELLYDWDNEDSFNFANVLVLRGLSFYKPKKFQYNMMWNISHPDKIELDEYKSYDHVFIASEKWKNHLESEGLDNVSTLLQCTDPDVFKIPKKSEGIDSEILFVGNSRGVFRKIISDLLPTKFDLSIYGGGWKGIVDDEYVKGEYLDNKELYKYYGGAKVLLNDHWDDMREKGFISNRIFDALACGSVVLTDNVEGMDVRLSDLLYVYKSKHELKKTLAKIIDNPTRTSAEATRKAVIKAHTFKNRVERINNYINDSASKR